ncbi:SMP-30/gluconolactonase/LRE family protein [Allorhizocola rhizosphaerae]|uniref:SMP-30/gluconolactonase/LRE family protein n=1 Tax=Allorhizocola rhizosphaerae TaxID=1872709 RepID=UPI000E3D58A6|nr:superoxide dismutase [Allorhizocola rhizosphaerae]
MDRRQALTGLAATVAATLLVAPEQAAAHGGSDKFPTLIPLPDNWLPEGVAIGDRPFAYFGSRADGSIYRANLVTGEGAPLPTPGPGTPAVGLKIDDRGRLFVAGGGAGNGRVVNAFTGEILANYQFTTAIPTFVNDVVLTPRAAYFTDSRQAALYVVRISRRGRLAEQAETLPLSGDLVLNPAVNNANGICRTPDGEALIIVQSNTGMLFRVDPATGVTTTVDLGGEVMTNGDGLLQEGRTLYVVQNRLNTVAVLRLARDGSSARVTDRLTDPRFNVPTTVASFGNRLYLPNAKFGANPPATTFEAIAIPKP